MRLPDFIVIGAQKSGTTSLFLLLNKNPKIFLPLKKETQFFSSAQLYPKGIEWYSAENFANSPDGTCAGEISPQYMFNTNVPRRIHAALPNTKLIAILRDPLDRAYSQYKMSVRRGQETRDFSQAIRASADLDETNTEAPEAQRYLQFSDYETVLTEYVRLFGRDNILIVLQEDLDKKPAETLKKIYDFLGLEYFEPENIGVRAHQAGTVRLKSLDKITKGNSVLRRVGRYFVPKRIRPALMYWLEMTNIKKSGKEDLDAASRKPYAYIVKQQKAFLKDMFDLDAPWPLADQTKTK